MWLTFDGDGRVDVSAWVSDHLYEPRQVGAIRTRHASMGLVQPHDDSIGAPPPHEECWQTQSEVRTFPATASKIAATRVIDHPTEDVHEPLDNASRPGDPDPSTSGGVHARTVASRAAQERGGLGAATFYLSLPSAPSRWSRNAPDRRGRGGAGLGPNAREYRPGASPQCAGRGWWWCVRYRAFSNARPSSRVRSRAGLTLRSDVGAPPSKRCYRTLGQRPRSAILEQKNSDVPE